MSNAISKQKGRPCNDHQRFSLGGVVRHNVRLPLHRHHYFVGERSMTENAEKYAWWNAAIAGDAPEIPPELPCGFFRVRWGNQHNDNVRFIPVAVWFKDESYHIMMGAKPNARMLAEDEVNDWIDEPHRVGEAVSQADWQTAYETGEWPGGFPTQVQSNNPPSDFEALKAEIQEAYAEMQAVIGDAVTTQEACDRATNLKDRINKLGKRAEELRKAEQKPHDEQVKAVRAKWRPLTDLASEAVDAARKAITPFLKAKERKLQEAAAKKIEAGEAVKPDTIKAQAGGASGRKTGLRTVKKVEIFDYPAALQFFADNEQVKSLIATLARKGLAAGGAVPGAKLVEEKVAA
ncbi:MAG: hypothetical protein AAF692_11145 [Pseudomonadota bacterium]